VIVIMGLVAILLIAVYLIGYSRGESHGVRVTLDYWKEDIRCAAEREMENRNGKS
jgi:hypothetical protein